MSLSKPGTCKNCGPVENYYCRDLCTACYCKMHRKENQAYYSNYDKSRREYKRELDRKRYQRRKDSGYFKLMYQKHIEQRRIDDATRAQTEHRKLWIKEWRLTNIDKVRESYRRKYHKHKEKHIARVMERRTHKGIQTPSWLNEHQRLEMQKFYKNRPQGFHVDHIIPLQGKEVKGLHVPWNLQYLPSQENLRKGNRV